VSLKKEKVIPCKHMLLNVSVIAQPLPSLTSGTVISANDTKLPLAEVAIDCEPVPGTVSKVVLDPNEPTIGTVWHKFDTLERWEIQLKGLPSAYA
jgi:hypothetical protein